MNDFEQNLHISDSAFDGMRKDADRVLQRLLKNMVEKESVEGSVTIKIDISLATDYISSNNPDADGEARKIIIPLFSHKVGSLMQIKDEAKGGIKYEGYEMVWSDDLKEYVVKPVANTTQRSIFDEDFSVRDVEFTEVHEERSEALALDDRVVAALPELPSKQDDQENETEENQHSNVEDISDTFGDDDNPKLPFELEDDEYDYSEPDEF